MSHDVGKQVTEDDTRVYSPHSKLDSPARNRSSPKKKSTNFTFRSPTFSNRTETNRKPSKSFVVDHSHEISDALNGSKKPIAEVDDLKRESIISTATFHTAKGSFASTNSTSSSKFCILL